MKENLQRLVATAKSVCIIALAVFAVYQITQLWFVNLTNRNFFPYLEARFPPAVPDGRSAWALPYRIVTGAGNGRFSIRYSGVATSAAWEYGENAMDAILRSGSFAGVHERVTAAGRGRIQERPVFIYEYAFEMCAETFAMALGRRNGAALTSHGVERFNSIAVQPPFGDDSFLRVFFMDSAHAWEFTLAPGTRRHPEEDFEFSMPHISDREKHFVAVGNSFAPRAPNGFLYWQVEAHNPHLTPEGWHHWSTVRPPIEVFFSNPATINETTGVDGIFTFTSRHTTVFYLPFDVLEYTSYRTIGRTASGDLLSDFSAAMAFIEADHNVENEIFLMNYEASGRVHIFRFGYVIDNFPLKLTDSWRTGPNCLDALSAPIEVVVDHGRVVRYRRLAYSFRPGGMAWFNPEALNIEEPFTLGFRISREPSIELEVFYTMKN